MCLFRGDDKVRRDVQIEIVLPPGFPVVRNLFDETLSAHPD